MNISYCFHQVVGGHHFTHFHTEITIADSTSVVKISNLHMMKSQISLITNNSKPSLILTASLAKCGLLLIQCHISATHKPATYTLATYKKLTISICPFLIVVTAGAWQLLEPLRTRSVGADVASMKHTATLSSANEVQLVESFAIAGFAEGLLNKSCCLSPVISLLCLLMTDHHLLFIRTTSS